MKRAHRLDQVQPSLTLAITAKAAAMKAEGADIVSFGAGEPDFSTPASVVEAAKRALDEGRTKYTPVAGLPALRAGIAQWYGREFGVEVSSDEVIVGVGGKQVIYNALMSMIDPGDKVLIPAPYWLSYPAMVHLCGGESVFVETQAADEFLVSPEALERALTSSGASALILNSPCNPTGQAYRAAQLTALAEVLRRHEDVVVIWDNIYAHLTYGGFRHTELVSVAPDLRPRIVTTCGFSKSFSMTGWRLGFAIASAERIKAMTTIQSHSTSNATSFAQYGALAALDLKHADLESMRAKFERRRQVMLDGLSQVPGVSYVPPKGAFYVLVDCASYFGGDDVALAKHLLEEGHVATIPGAAFGAPGCLRLSFALDEASIRKGIERIGQVLSRCEQTR